MDKIKIQVTQEDINKGISGNCTECPIALAVLRALPHFQMVRVGHDMIHCWVFAEDKEKGRWHYNAGNRTYDIPREAQDFIRDYDRDRPVEPFEFEIMKFIEG